jgi:signal transduction histidine kinase
MIAAGGLLQADFLAGAGEMGALIRAFDWMQTPLGPIELWPQSLKTSVSLILSSRHPMWIGWGPEVTFLYNDAYLHVLGPAKHPHALGAPASKVWAEIWDVIGPLADKVFESGEATFVDDLRLFMDRGDYLEETFYSFSYSPIRDETGVISGLFCPSTDVTPKVIHTRRLGTLSELGANSLVEKTTTAACATAARILAKNPDDVPFALLYLAEANGKRAFLEQSVGRFSQTLVSSVDLTSASTDAPWPIAEVFRSSQRQIVSTASIAGLPKGVARRKVSEAVVLPVLSRGEHQPYGVLVAGVNPCRPLDSDHITFFELLAGQVATAIQNARAVEEEKKRADMLAEIDRTKTAFFSNVSHEFRTPLTLMLGPLEELIAASDSSPTNRNRAAMAHRNCLRLLRLVNSLLDFSRIEAGRIQAQYEPTDLSTFTAQIASNFRSACEQAGLDLVIDCPELTDPVFVDREMWEKIVLNLISNAFKFTLEGSIKVAIAAVDGYAELTVSDTGAGIPEEELPRLFDRFHRVEGSRGRTHEGTGIGLALVQELVKAHGGTISVASALEKGSTFAVRIPFGRGHLPADRIRTSSAAATTTTRAEMFVQEALRWLPGEQESRGSVSPFEPDELGTPLQDDPASPGEGRARILLVEDNADMRDYVRRLLTPHMEVTIATNGRQALQSALDSPPDLVLSDVMMPALDGFALLRELRSNPQTTTIPVVLLSARAGEEARVEGAAAGADDYLVKPFTARELLARVNAHLNLARLRRRALDDLRRTEGELRRHQQQLARQLIELRHLNDDLNQFAFSASHDLQEPLRNISIYSQLLQRKLSNSGDPETLDFLSILVEGTARMEALLRDLLAYTRITSDSIERGLADGNIVLQKVMNSLDAAIRESGAVILPGNLPVVPVSEVHLHQLLQNLIGNAIKYRDPARPLQIRINAQEQEAGWKFSVADNGIGIAPEYHQRIFGVFKRLHSSDRYTGTGIGLAIAQKIVNRYGGSIWVESQPGNGANFSFILPKNTHP